MSRLLTALKRLDDSGGNPSVERRSAGRESATNRGDSQPPLATPRSQASPQSAPASPQISPATQVSADSAIAPWPSGEPAVADVDPLAPADNSSVNAVASPVTATEPRRKRAPSPGRRATDHYRVAPEYAALCQAILQQLPRTRPTAILVVPAAANVDAGTVAAELALSMAQAVDLPVVAIDADITAETDAVESAVTTSGLTDVLLDRVDWRGVLAPARDSRVQLLAAGRPLSAGELSRGEAIASAAARLGPIAAEIKTRYRYLIVHGGSPSNPLAGSLVQASDLVYLVVRLGQTTRRSARHAKRLLQRGGAIVHGSILLANS
ncbi:MAG: hypothetical protein WD875_04540 [Pirellulales bacterium]